MEKILLEEKKYWIDQALEAREDVERHAAATRKAVAERDEVEKALQEMKDKLFLIGEVIIAAHGTGHDLSGVMLNLLSVDELKKLGDKAGTPRKYAKMPTTYTGKDLVLMAWAGNGGGVYADTRALSKTDAARIHNIRNRHNNGKIPLYALDPHYDE